jgi:pyruvate dehydrogenase E2 component (dihydrolipoamide acetyltransferase)
MSEIVMPRLSDTMEEGTILRWLKGDGEHVQRGEELVEIETDKAAMPYESDLQGTLEILVAEGATVPVGAVIANVLAPGESTGAAAPGVAQPQAPAPVPQPAPAQARTQTPEGERVRASPLARRVARENGIDLHGVTGSGPGGRIVRADVVASHADGDGQHAPALASAAPDPIATAKGQTTAVELTRTQQTVARRMAESKATIPEFTLRIDVDMQECVALRAELKRISQPEEGGSTHAPTYNDMVVKAAALALREHPRANGSYRDGRLTTYSRVNVGVAVAADESLVVPTVFDADEKSLGEIARETRALAERVRSGAITPPELGGGTFTVSNLGMYGVQSFTAIINPPQAAILSVGALEPRPVARDGAVIVRHMLTLTLACDHRILYGAQAAQLLSRVRELLQSPASLSL